MKPNVKPLGFASQASDSLAFLLFRDTIGLRCMFPCMAAGVIDSLPYLWPVQKEADSSPASFCFLQEARLHRSTARKVKRRNILLRAKFWAVAKTK